MKRLIGILFFMMLLSLCFFSALAENGQLGDDLYYTIDANGAVNISGTGKMWNYGSDTTHGRYSPFYNNSTITSVTIESGMTSISYDAFGFCRNMTDITIPSTVVSIDLCAFEGCSSLKSIVIPGGVTIIRDYTFRGCSSLTSVTIPNSVTVIGDFSFENCDSLTSIAIPNSVGSIENYAFGDCDELTKIDIKGNAPRISNYAFEGVTATVYYPSRNTSWTDEVRVDYGGTLKWASRSATSEDGTYNKCGNNLSFSISKGVLTVSGTGAMWDYEGESAPFPKKETIRSIVIKSGVTGIGDHAFEYCTELTSITIPSSVTVIGNYAFVNCYMLKELQLPSGLTRIGESAFEDCDGLTSITIPSGVTKIGDNAFQRCTALTEITIPKSVATIESSAFSKCSSLKRIDFEGSAPNILFNAFDSVTATVYYPIDDASWTESKCQDYGGTLTWVPAGECAAHRPLLGAVEPATQGASGSIGATVCEVCSKELAAEITILHALLLPEELVQIEAEAFAGADMQQVTIPNGATGIGERAFANCKSLCLVVVPSSISFIPDSAFAGCSELVILCEENSAAQRFAIAHELPYSIR